MTRQVNLYEAKTQLSRLVEEAAKGDTIVIAKGGKPMAKLGPVSKSGKRRPRKLGQLAGHAKNVDWVQWWHDWKTADKEIEADFESGAGKPFPTPHTKRKRS